MGWGGLDPPPLGVPRAKYQGDAQYSSSNNSNLDPSIGADGRGRFPRKRIHGWVGQVAISLEQ